MQWRKYESVGEILFIVEIYYIINEAIPDSDNENIMTISSAKALESSKAANQEVV